MNLGSWYWAFPAATWLLPGAVLPWVLQAWRDHRVRGLAFSQIRLAQGLIKQPHQYGRWVSPCLQTLAWLGLVAALARPWTPVGATSHLEGRSVDTLLTLDVSRSMCADDILPTRLEASKTFLKNFALQHPGARLGLVVFAGHSLLRVPLTTDHALLLDSLAGVSVASADGEGTALGDALHLSEERLLAADGPTPKNGTLRLAVVVTDGVNHTGVDPIEAVRSLARRGIDVCLVGVGQTLPKAHWEWDESVGQKRPVTDVYGRPEYWETLDEKNLRQLMLNHGHGYFLRLDQPQMQEPVWTALKHWESGAQKRATQTRKQELFWLPLLFSFLCMSAEYILSQTRFRRLRSI